MEETTPKLVFTSFQPSHGLLFPLKKRDDFMIHGYMGLIALCKEGKSLKDQVYLDVMG